MPSVKSRLKKPRRFILEGKWAGPVMESLDGDIPIWWAGDQTTHDKMGAEVYRSKGKAAADLKKARQNRYVKGWEIVELE